MSHDGEVLFDLPTDDSGDEGTDSRARSW